MHLTPEEDTAFAQAARFCRELLSRKDPTREQCIHIGIALRGLEAFPSPVPNTAVEIGVVSENGQNHESWVLQVYGSSVTLSAGGSEWSHGHDHFTRFNFHVEAPAYVALSGDVSEFEEIYKEIEWDGYRLYTKDDAGCEPVPKVWTPMTKELGSTPRAFDHSGSTSLTSSLWAQFRNVPFEPD